MAVAVHQSERVALANIDQYFRILIKYKRQSVVFVNHTNMPEMNISNIFRLLFSTNKTKSLNKSPLLNIPIFRNYFLKI